MTASSCDVKVCTYITGTWIAKLKLHTEIQSRSRWQLSKILEFLSFYTESVASSVARQQHDSVDVIRGINKGSQRTGIRSLRHDLKRFELATIILNEYFYSYSLYSLYNIATQLDYYDKLTNLLKARTITSVQARGKYRRHFSFIISAGYGWRIKKQPYEEGYNETAKIHNT